MNDPIHAIRSARNVSLSRACRAVSQIMDELTVIRDEIFPDNQRGINTAMRRRMPIIREALAELNKCIHETNAYNNSLNSVEGIVE